ncbi:MAG: right-handed parallel beta-helix repeat-containing protein [Bacteroidia bacterium]
MLWGAAGFGLLLWAQLTGTYFINGTTDFVLRSYESIQLALDHLSAQGAQGTVIFRVVSPYNPALEPYTIRVKPYTCLNCEVILLIDTPITIAKAPPAEWWAGQFVLRIQGGVQRFTLNGRGNLTLKCLTDTTAFTGVIGILPSTAGGISHIRIDSCIIEGLGRSKTWTAIYIGDSASNVFRPVPAPVSQVTISACTLRSARYGAAFVSGGWGGINQVTLNRCIIGYPSASLSDAESSWRDAAVFAQLTTNLLIDSCLVEGCWYTGPRSLVGLHLDRCSNVILRKNIIRNIHSLSDEGFGAAGILCIRNPNFGPSPHLIENNFIGDILASTDESLPGSSSYLAAGVVIESQAVDNAATFTLRHNTIHLYGMAESRAIWARDGFAAGVVLGRFIRGGVELSNNLIQNTLHLRSSIKPDRKETCALAFWEPADQIQWNSLIFRNNFYFVQGAVAERTYIARIGAGATKRTIGSLAEWRSFSGSDLESRWGVTGGAPFISMGDPHISPTTPWIGINAGYTSGMPSQDIDGESRPQGGTNDPGAAPDIGADEVAGTVLPCPSPATQPLSASTNAGLVGSYVALSVPNPASLSGELLLAWSVDNGLTWRTQAVLPSDFPFSFVLPEPPSFPGSVEIRLIALSPPGCPASADTSSAVIIQVHERPGNRPSTAIPLTFASAGAGIWVAMHSDSLLPPGLTNVYDGVPGASASPELFFTLTLPDCVDSLDIDLCSEETDFDTRLHLIEALDTITDRDQGYHPTCLPAAIPASLTSRIIALGYTQREIPTTENFAQPARPKIPLPAGANFLLVVEGETPLDLGRFKLTAQAYKLPLSKPDLGPDRNVCISPTGFQLSGFVPGANAYQWFLNGQVVPNETDSVIRLLLPLGTHTVVVEARREPTQLCAPLRTARDTVRLTVLPSIDAHVVYDTLRLENGDTLPLPFGTHTLTAQAGVSGATFSWRLRNRQNVLIDWTTGPTYTREWGERGLFLLELQSQTADCSEIDSIWVNVQPPSEPAFLLTENTAPMVYPNPTHGELFIKAFQAEEVLIFDLRGRLVFRSVLHPHQTNRLQLHLPAGAYKLTFLPHQVQQLLFVQP